MKEDYAFFIEWLEIGEINSEGDPVAENQDKQEQQDQKAAELNALKEAHDLYATTIHLLKTRTTFYFEEFQGVMNQVGFYTNLRDQLLARIHEVEPPKPKEPQKPYIVDVPVKPEVTQ